MEIQELILKGYGKFENHRLTLKPGINIIYGKNETGKTTIHSFIRSMLFGLDGGRGKAADKDEYQVRRPWTHPDNFLGTVTMTKGGERYRIERCFDRSAQWLSVVCETTNREYERPQEALARLLGGVSEEAFVNTVFVSQMQCETDEALALELQRYMVNSGRTMDAQLDVTWALRGLRKKKKEFEQKKRKQEEILEKKIQQKQANAEVIRGQLELLKRQVRETRRRRERGRDRTENGEEASEETRSQWGRIALEINQMLGGRRRADEMQKTVQDESRERLRNLTEEIRNYEEAYQKLQDDMEELYRSHVKMDSAETEIAAVTMAIDRICELSGGIYAKAGGRLNRRASEILSELTKGAYSRIVLDEEMEVRIHTSSRVLGLHQVSGGTMQQIYFALRMAFAEILCEKETLPVILDETFAMYDDERLEAALRWLRKSGRQVILFTCQRREREILNRICRSSEN